MLAHIIPGASVLTNDILVVVTLFVLFFAAGLYFGKGRLLSLVISFYPALFLYKLFPYAEKLTVLSGPQFLVLNKIGIFLLFLIPFDIIVSRFIFSESGYGGSLHIMRVAGLSLAMTVLLLVFSYSTVSLDVFYNFSSTIDTLFVSGNIFWWMLAPFLILFFI